MEPSESENEYNIVEFLEEMCVSREQCKVGTSDLLAAYNNWAIDKGYTRLDATNLSALMRMNGYEKTKSRFPGHENPKNAYIQVALKLTD